MKKLSLIFISFIVSFTLTAQGPLDGYFKGRNVLDLAFSIGAQGASTYTGANGTFAASRTLFMGSLFAEYGLTDRIDIIATLPFITSQFQDAGLYIKAKMIDGRIAGRPFTLAPGIGFSTPASKYDPKSFNSIGQRASLLHGHLIAQSTLFGNFSLQAQGAYHYSLETVPSSVTVSSKLIYSKDSWYLDAWYEYQKGQGDVSYMGSIPYDSFREFFVDYNRIGGVIYKGLDKGWGVFVNASTILNGMNTFNTTTVMGGFVKKFDFAKREMERAMGNQKPRNKFN